MFGIVSNALYLFLRMSSHWCYQFCCIQTPKSEEFMADECTHISITKELILYACILCGSEVHACFLKIDIRDGKAETIEKMMNGVSHPLSIELWKE